MESIPTIVTNFHKKLREGGLTLEDSKECFDWCLSHGRMGRVDNELHVDETLTAFESHIHLDVHRFPPSGILSKRRLRPTIIEHQPWWKLLNDDFDPVFYSDPIESLAYLKSRVPDDLVARIKAACESNQLFAMWSDFSQELAVEGQSDAEIRSLFEDLSRSFDLPALLAVTRGMKQVGIPYKLAKRKHAMIAYQPYIIQTEDPEKEEFRSFDIELVFIAKTGAHSIHDLGSGVRVIIPVIVALATAEVGLLSIEEPESHVHPKLQAELGDLLVQRTGWTYYEGPIDGYSYQLRWNGENRRKSNTIVETHSEHLILRILRRIRETTECEMDEWPDALRIACPNGIRPEDVTVLYVKPGADGAQVEPLRINELGEFVDEWPGGFFDERIREIL